MIVEEWGTQMFAFTFEHVFLVPLKFLRFLSEILLSATDMQFFTINYGWYFYGEL